MQWFQIFPFSDSCFFFYCSVRCRIAPQQCVPDDRKRCSLCITTPCGLLLCNNEKFIKKHCSWRTQEEERRSDSKVSWIGCARREKSGEDAVVKSESCETATFKNKILRKIWKALIFILTKSVIYSERKNNWLWDTWIKVFRFFKKILGGLQRNCRFKS